MNKRIDTLRRQSLDTPAYISAQRAQLLTEFYRANEGRYGKSLERAESFKYLCERKSIYIGENELIVGERGPAPKAVSTYPELTCHSVEDLEILGSRAKTSYVVSDETLAIYRDTIIPFWRGRSLRDQIFALLDPEWHTAYEAGIFTEFMEQRAPGHTVADGKIYRAGMADFKERIARRRTDNTNPTMAARLDQLAAMEAAADGAICFARRHGALARVQAKTATDATRRAELEKIASVCDRVPEFAPRDFQEALQMYWFCHLAVITELNGWDAFSPGHLDQHLGPFYDAGLAEGTMTRSQAKELLACFFIKFNNHPAPPKVGVTAAESGTYTDFANINLGGLLPGGGDGVNEVTFILLEVIDELHILQPSQNVQISRCSDDRFLREACRVIRQGYGFPSVFNCDCVIEELKRQGKSEVDAREGGTSGCVEAGAFGKEAYILTGYFNLPKLLELALNDGRDPGSNRQIGPHSGDARLWTTREEMLAAWQMQLNHFLAIKLEGNHRIERLYAKEMPAPFLSLITDDCIESCRDYNAGGARYNTSYIQGVGIGTLTDCFAAIDHLVFERQEVDLPHLLEQLENNFAGSELLQLRLRNKPPKWGNDDDRADQFMSRAFDMFYDAVEGVPNQRGGLYHINMLPTTCHVYFGSVIGATPDGRSAAAPLSEGISPVQGMDRGGPVAILQSAAKMDHVRTGGTLLNMKFLPQVLAGELGLSRLGDLIRSYFTLGGHHIQFNVVDSETLRRAQADPDSNRGLIVRVAGYSDYFCDLPESLQEEIIARTEQRVFDSIPSG
jgi:trans-4-hydroxy-L-proline dehydratase